MSSPDTPTTDQQGPGSRLTRRGLLVSGGAIAVGGVGVLAANWFNITASAGQEGMLSVTQAHEASVAGTITLIDIRRPDEWARTGVGQAALPLDMRRTDFTDVLLAKVGGDKDAPVALICARGVRSRGLTARLVQAGFTNIIDIPEGMLGSGAGPGWLKTGLPVVAAE